MTADLAYALTAAVVLGCAAFKIWQMTRRPRSAHSVTQYALVTCLLALSTALALQVTPLNTAIDRLLGGQVSYLAFAPALAMIGTCGYQCFVVSINDPDSAAARIRWRVLVAAAAVAVTIALAWTDHPALRDDNPVSWRASPLDALQLGTYAAYMGFGAVDVARLAYRFTRLGDQALLRLGLLMVTAGAYVAGAYSAAKLAFLFVGVLLDRNFSDVGSLIFQPMIVVGALLTSIGSTLPAWGRWLGIKRPAEWVSMYLSFLTLYQLWQPLHSTWPQIALHPASSRWERYRPNDIHYRLARRVIEIRDGLLLLRGFRTAEAAALADRLAGEHGLRGLDRSAAVEAAEIALALQGKRAEISVKGGIATARSEQPAPNPSPVDSVSAHIGDEVSWLARVTHALRYSPMVRAARQWQADGATAAAGYGLPV